MYRLYVDEVGTDGLESLTHDNHRYLSLTGVAMRIEHARDDLEPKLNLIKAKIFDHDPDSPLVFHRKEILGFKGCYERLRDPQIQGDFNSAILSVFSAHEYAVITALIDKHWMIRQGHWERLHPYHYLAEIMVEKFTQFLERHQSLGDIMPESRQGKDHLLQHEFNRVRDLGTEYVNAHRIRASIPSKILKFRTKKDNVAGLQLCDLLAHPSHIYTRKIMGHEVSLGKFSSGVVDIMLRQKYDRGYQGKIVGYGIKYLPR